jgi:hypothetical protein
MFYCIDEAETGFLHSTCKPRPVKRLLLLCLHFATPIVQFKQT